MTYWKLFSKLKFVILSFTCLYVTLKVSGYQQDMDTALKSSMCLSVFLHPWDNANVNTQLFTSSQRTSGEHHAAYKAWGSNGSKGRSVIITWRE